MPPSLNPWSGHSTRRSCAIETATVHANARTYRIGRGMAVFLAVGTLAFLGAAVASAVQEPTLGRRIVLAGAFCVFAGVGVAAVVQTRLYRVTIDDDGIEFVRWRRLRRMSVEQILGFRRGVMRGGTMLVFVPRDRSAKPLKIPAWFSLDAPFEAWLKRLPNVDALDRERSEAELLASSALGATPAARKATLARARVVAHLLNWPAVAIALWVFVFPRPYLLAVAAAFLFPLLALAAAILGRGAYQFLGKRNDARPVLLLALLMPWISASIRAFDFDLVAPGALIVPALAVGTVLTALIFMGDRTLREKPALALMILPLVTGASAAAMTVANCSFDGSSPRVHEAVVLDKHVTRGKGAAWFLELGPWGPRTAPEQVKVRRSMFDAVTVNRPVRVHLHEGRLGFPWFRVAGPTEGGARAERDAASISPSAAGWIKGRVVDRDDAGGLHPIGDFYVRSPAFPTAHVEQEDGRFEIGVPRLWVGAPLLVAAPGLAPFATRFNLTERATLDLGDIVLGPGRAIRGTVRDASGLPVEGASVRIGYTNGALEEPAAMTDASGSFELAGISRDDAALTVSHPRFRRQDVVAGAGSTGLEVRLSPGMSLSVYVEDDAGAPISGARVWDVISHAQCTTGLDGGCTLTGLEQREQALEARLPGEPRPTPSQLRVPFFSATPAPVAVRLPRRPWVLRVMVAEPDGRPARASVAVIPEAVPPDGAVGSSGEIDLPHYPGGMLARFENLPTRTSTVVVRSLDGGGRCTARIFEPAGAGEQLLTVELPANGGPCRP